MMLRASVNHQGDEPDLSGINGLSDSTLPYGSELVAFAEAIVGGDRKGLFSARTALTEAAGRAFMVDAAAVAANFEMMTRVADTTGAAVDKSAQERTAPTRLLLGVDDFQSARWG
jgi:hypothetical protein